MRWNLGMVFGLCAVIWISGCSSTPAPAASSADAFVAQKLLSDLAFIRAKRTRPTFHDWEACASSLEYLLQRQDAAAEEFAIRVLPRLAEVDQVLDREMLNLGYDAYYGWESLNRILKTMPLRDQFFIVELLDDLDPVDWAAENGDQILLLAANPQLQAAYLESPAKTKRGELDPRAGQ